MNFCRVNSSEVFFLPQKFPFSQPTGSTPPIQLDVVLVDLRYPRVLRVKLESHKWLNTKGWTLLVNHIVHANVPLWHLRLPGKVFSEFHHIKNPFKGCKGISLRDDQRFAKKRPWKCCVKKWTKDLPTRKWWVLHWGVKNRNKSRNFPLLQRFPCRFP